MKHTQMISILLAIAVLLLSVKLLYVEQKSNSPKTDVATKENNVLENIMTRTSIREYTQEKINEEQINKLLKAGMAAPSSGNKQPWCFVVIDDMKTKEEITANIGPAQPAAKAPLVIVVCADTTKTFNGDAHDYWIEDCSAVTENILLAAHGMGLGAVWLGVYPQMKRCEFLRRLLSLPKHVIPLGMVAIGHPAEQPPQRINGMRRKCTKTLGTTLSQLSQYRRKSGRK